MAMDSKEWLCRSKSQKFGAETMFQLSGPLPKVSHTSTRRSGLGNGSGFNSVLLIRLKIVVLAPMPRARVTIATIVKPGFRDRFRKP